MTESPHPTPTTKATLGLTGLTVNAMALIAPGAFLWLTYSMQCQYGAPVAGSGMWFGIVVALALCFATAIAYAELSKLYPSAGSSYFFAEQAFLAKTPYARFARIAKFVVGWASHLYYWIYPGVMVGVTALLAGYLAGQFFPEAFSPAVPSPLFMLLFCAVFATGVAYIAFRGVVGTTGINLTINVIQIVALLVFSFMAISYRMNHPDGSKGYTLDPDGVATSLVIATDKDGKPIKDAADAYVYEKDVTGNPKPFVLTYAPDAAVTHEPADAAHPEGEKVAKFQFHTSAVSAVVPHEFSFAFIQACIAILILVGFESVTAMGEEAKNARRDIPRAVLLSLGIQGIVCYLIEYFAANYFLNSGYTMTQAAGSAAPIGDMMTIIGAWFFGSAAAGRAFMLVQAFTVFLALIGTTLSCLSTGARVTYAMGRDEEVPAHFGLLHGKRLTPHRSIWTLAAVSAVIGMICVAFNFCGPAAQTDEVIASLPHNAWYSFGLIHNASAAAIPQMMLVMTLACNFGTFLLYMLTCVTAVIAFKGHPTFSLLKHLLIPVFGLLTNLLCMLFYLVGPFFVPGMSRMEPFVALGIAALWGGYGAWYFVRTSRARNKPLLLNAIPGPAVNNA